MRIPPAMLDVDSKEYQSILKKLLAYAETQLSATKMKLIKPFIERYYAQVPVDELKEKATVDLFGAILSHWELMYQRKPGEYKRQIFNPNPEKDGWETTHTVLEFILDDQPFLVDSLRNEINRKGLTVHFIVNLGGIKILRNDQNKIIKVLPFDSQEEGAIKEAPIYIEIDRQTNPESLETLIHALDRVIHDARIAVVDWKKMVDRTHVAIEEMETTKPPVTDSELKEVSAFLEWMVNNHFTFLGYRQYDMVGEGEERALQLVPKSGLGVLRDTSHSRVKRYYAELPPEARKIALSKQHIVLLAKTNTRSTVHGDRYTDYVSIKRFNQAGDIIGEHWFIGLYTSTIYSESAKTIPIIRIKESEILQKSKLPRNGHSYKALEHILETLPRDDLFHANVEELMKLSIGILQLQDRHRIRLFARKDVFSRFISCFVYVPRDDFNIELANRMQEILKTAFHGLEISYTTLFSDSILARLHYTVRIDPKKHHRYDLKAIEQKLIAVGRSWQDGLHESLIKYFGEEQGNILMMGYKRAFPISYQEAFSPLHAVFDIEKIEKITQQNQLEISIYRPENVPDNIIDFKLFYLQAPIVLSDTVPIMEKMGFRVLGEQPYKIQAKDGSIVWIHDFCVRAASGQPIALDHVQETLQDTFKKVLNNEAEHDGFNALSLFAYLKWREITIVRAYAKYLRQIGLTFSQDYVEQALLHNPDVTRLLVQLFLLRTDPSHQNAEIEAEVKATEDQINTSLDAVVNLDEDRILRMFLNLILATIRTNYFQVNALGEFKSYLSFKLNPTLIQDLPLPIPKYEIFVYSPRFEGIHLRAGKVARGGIRWSDRKEDFRQEVLGLMKAQQVKNAVIVPTGAKGGFVTKQLPVDSSRDVIQKEGIACYKDFIRGLLDLTDNLIDHKVISPPNTVCYDDHDPYLVVAADKGTATFSDIANGISHDYQFWLKDAFASGGSAGYDHKKIAITARGAWESVKWHFQELNIDIENHPFTVFGIGDMSGDVFGNGVLQSQQIKLLTAINGTHIFIDPNPDPAISYAERKRLFELPRSTWEDYNPKLISSGGGVYKRSLKAIKLSPEVKQWIGVKKDQMTPNELIRALLKAPVDLLWNGGIGTFVKAQVETNADVSDRSNDAIRVNGNELTCKVVGEGGNLGFTQLARIEYELNGGRINTDFIDNSGGVDCSDHEVNLKILLNGLVSRHEMTEKKRNVLLTKMTDDVAHLVLHNNYRQVRAISIAVRESFYYLGLYQNLIKDNAREGKINPALEFLPDDAIFMARKAAGKGLTRPEIAVLSAYSKIILKAEIIESDLPEDLYLNRYIQYAFPELIRRNYLQAMEQHRLRREIMATQLSNLLVTDMGITFVYQMADEVRTTIANIVRAYVVAREIFNLDQYWKAIESLNVPVDVQLEMTSTVIRLIRRSVRWLLRNHRILNVEPAIAHYMPGVRKLSQHLPELLKGTEKTYFETTKDQWVASGVPEPIAANIAITRAMYSLLNIVKTSIESKSNLNQVAQVYFDLTDRLSLDDFSEMVNHYPLESHWMVLARSAVKGDLDWHQRLLTLAVLKMDVKVSDPIKRLALWLTRNAQAVESWQTTYTEMKTSSAYEYSMLVVAMRELFDLARSE